MQLLDIRKYGFVLVMLLSASLIIISCGDDDEPEEPGTCETTNLTYDNFARNFLIANCSTMGGCHVEANKDDQSIGSYETYEDTKAVVDRGNLLQAISFEDGDGVSNMPKGGTKLDDCSISKLTAWINDGAPE